MLPEKKKNLIIGTVSMLVLISVILGIYFLTSFIKDKKKEEVLNNDPYPSKYSYIGVLKNEDDIYEFYGISDEEEEYLDIHSFYDITSFINVNGKLLFYSDGVNELRYDKKNNKFYLYELDSYYSNKMKCFLTDKYVILTSDKYVGFKEIGNEKIVNIGEDIENFYYNNSHIYYLETTGIVDYDLDKRSKSVIAPSTLGNFVILGCNDEYVYYKRNDLFYAYNIKEERTLSLTSFNGEYVSTCKEGIFYKQDINGYQLLKKYDVRRQEVIDYDYIYDYKIVSNKLLGDNKYFQVIGDELKRVVLSLDEKRIVKEFKNNYLDVMEVNDVN